MYLELLIPKANEILIKEMMRRDNIANENKHDYSIMVSKIYEIMKRRRYSFRITGHTFWEGMFSTFGNGYRSCITKWTDTRHILKLIIRDHLSTIFCFDIANVIISFYEYDITSDAMFKIGYKKWR